MCTYKEYPVSSTEFDYWINIHMLTPTLGTDHIRRNWNQFLDWFVTEDALLGLYRALALAPTYLATTDKQAPVLPAIFGRRDWTRTINVGQSGRN